MTGAYKDSPLIELESSQKIRTVAFASNGEYLVSGHYETVRAWRVEDGEQTATMAARRINCLAVSQDGRWIAAGTKKDVFVWDAKTYEKVFTLEDHYVIGVDFSPDSTQLATASLHCTATIWNIGTRERIVLRHEDTVRAAKYSPQGDRIATATPYSVQIWDTNDGCLLVHIPVKVTPWFNTGLLWFNNNLFVLSNNKIKQFEASTGSKISEWSVADADNTSSIALPQHREFIAHSTKRTVTFWDTSTYTQLGLIQHPQDICSIALSPDDRFLAIGEKGGKITVRSLSRIIASIMSRTGHGVSEHLSFSGHIST